VEVNDLSGWAVADSLAARLSLVTVPDDRTWYRFGDAHLAVRANDRPFLERLGILFAGCATHGREDGLRTVDAAVRVDPDTGGTLLSVEGCDPADGAEFAEAVFGDDGVRRLAHRGKWTVLGRPGDDSWSMAANGPDLVLTRGAPWPYLVGASLVHRTMSTQPNVLFVHAAAMEIGGAGVLLVGPTGSGKTTLSVGLAARGYGFLSDEIGAIRLSELSLLPFPRAAGVRAGPRTSAAEALLTEELPVERFADGSSKSLVPAAAFETAPLGSAVPLRHIVLLAGRGARAEWTELDTTTDNLRYVNPVKSTTYSASSGSKTLALIRLAAAVRWHGLIAGYPDDTVALIEQRIGER